MPLIHSPAKKPFEHNIKTEMEHGKPQKQALAIAFAVKRRASAKKKMAEGGMVPEEDMGRTHDKIGSHPSAQGESLHPSYRASMVAENMMKHLEHLGKKAQEHEELEEPNEPFRHVSPASEDLPAHMAKGGMIHPKHIAIMIMHKRKMADGGEAERSDFAKRLSEGVSKGPDAWSNLKAAFGGKKIASKAHGGEIEEGDSLDNMGLEDHPDNDFLSDEEQTPYHHLDEQDHVEDDEAKKEHRKGMLERIMRGLHAKHRGI